jgi:hypothetical protein
MGGMRPNWIKMWSSPELQKSSFIFGPDLMSTDQWSRLKSSMPFKHNLALHNIPLSKQPFKMQPQIGNEDVTWSSQYIYPSQESIKRRALSLQEVELDAWFLILHIILETRIP